MEADQNESVHDWLLVHFSPVDAYESLNLHLTPEQKLGKVRNLCTGANKSYSIVVDLARAAMTGGSGAPLHRIFDNDIITNAFAAQAPRNRLHRQALSSDRSRSGSSPSRSESSSRTSQSPTRSRSRSKSGDFVKGKVWSETGDDWPCSVGKSRTAYRFVRADFLGTIGPPHPTHACTKISVNVPDIGKVSSSECVRLIWNHLNAPRSHQEWFWIIEVDKKSICDILLPDKQADGKNAPDPELLEQKPSQGQAWNYRAASISDTITSSLHPSASHDFPEASQSDQGSISSKAGVSQDASITLKTSGHNRPPPMPPIFEQPKASIPTEEKQEDNTFVILDYSLEGYQREGELFLSDHDGEAFLAQLKVYYAKAGEGDLSRKRSDLQVQFTAMKDGKRTGKRRHCSLKPDMFARHWKRVIRFATENQHCDEFEVELQPKESDG